VVVERVEHRDEPPLGRFELLHACYRIVRSAHQAGPCHISLAAPYGGATRAPPPSLLANETLRYIRAMNATRESWKARPLPELRARIPYERTFSSEERATLARGLVPLAMEDRWFIFLDGCDLYLHRSWTGICIYVVRLTERDGGTIVEDAWVNRDPAEYKVTDDAHDVCMLGFLVDRLLLGLDVPFPQAIASPELRHDFVGYARPADDK
jgi:hypothetical protein